MSQNEYRTEFLRTVKLLSTYWTYCFSINVPSCCFSHSPANYITLLFMILIGTLWPSSVLKLTYSLLKSILKQFLTYQSVGGIYQVITQLGRWDKSIVFTSYNQTSFKNSFMQLTLLVTSPTSAHMISTLLFYSANICVRPACRPTNLLHLTRAYRNAKYVALLLSRTSQRIKWTDWKLNGLFAIFSEHSEDSLRSSTLYVEIWQIRFVSKLPLPRPLMVPSDLEDDSW